MHIPASMLHGTVCPVTAAVTIGGLGVATYLAQKSEEQPSVAKFSAVSALIFALQMLNFPIQNGTSGHLLGGVLAVSLLGIPFGVLSMAIVLAVQCIFFGDGGLNALGANILNMALLGAGVVGWIGQAGKGLAIHKSVKMLLMCWLSVMLAAFACSVEVAIAGTVSFSKVLPAMLSVHAIIGLGEGALTCLLIYSVFSASWFAKLNEKVVAMATLGMAVVAASLSPFASNFPDGLEWVSEKLSFINFSGAAMPGLFPDYQIPGIAYDGISTMMAGITGVAIVYLLSMVVGRLTMKFSLK